MFEIMQSESVQTKLISLAVTALTALARRIATAKPNVKWGIFHGFTFTVRNQNDGKFQNIQTTSIFIQNIGRATADGIEVHFNYKPEHLQIWPTINYDTQTNPEGRYTVKIENIAPRESLSIEMLSLVNLPIVLRVRTKNHEAKCVEMTHFQVPSKFKIGLIWALIWLGVFSIIQNLVIFLL